MEAPVGVRHFGALYLCFLSSVMESATTKLARCEGPGHSQAAPRKTGRLQGGGEGLEGGGAPFLPRAEEPTEGLFAPFWQLDLTLEPSSCLFSFSFFRGWLQIILFVYIAPKFYGTKDLQVQICPAFINFPFLFNLCDFNFPSLYC